MGLRIPLGALPGLALTIAVGSLSCAFFGLTLGALGLRFRDVWLVSNVSVSLLLLLTGVNVPADHLPAWMRVVGGGLPITHSAEAARRWSRATASGPRWHRLAKEVAVGAAYAVVAALLLQIFEAESRRRASSGHPLSAVGSMAEFNSNRAGHLGRVPSALCTAYCE